MNVDIERAPVAIPIGRRAASTIAWLLCASTLALVACAVVLASLNRYGEDLTYLGSPAAAALVGGLVASRRPTNPVGWFILGHALCFSLGEFSRQYAIYGFLTEPGSLPFARAAVWPAYWVWFPGLVLMFSLLPLYFPNGRLLSPRWRPAVWLAVFVALVAAGIGAFQPNDLEAPGLPNPLGIEALRPFVGVFLDVALPALWLILGLASVASLLVRFRRSRGEERQKIKWIGYAAVLMIAHIPLDLFLLQPLAPAAAIVLGNVFLAIPWAAIAVAVLRHRLYDIDLVINRTLVYGALSACLIGLYVLVVGYLGTLLRVGDNLAVSLVAAGVVAVLFAPLRDRLQRGVNRLMYGERDDPYAVLSRLGRRLEATFDPDGVLPAIVETVAHALRLPYAAIALKHDSEGNFFEAVEYGNKEPAGEPLVVTLAYQKETVGELRLSPRAPGEPFAESDLRLLEDLARQAGVAAHAVRLTTELQRSRERLVRAREEERRRLRRDLHDGVGPRLAALMLELETAGDLVAKDPEASALMTRLSEQARETIADVRRSVRALRPPALDELGLVGALREATARYGRAGGLEVSVEAPDALPPLPAAVEVACYLIAQEATTNVARHAKASKCRVRVKLDEEAGALIVEVEDDGRGIGKNDRVGVGTSSMRERAEELGGRCMVEPSAEGSGTLVRALLPLPSAKNVPRGKE